MSLNPFDTAHRAIKLFEIRLDQSTLVFRGSSDDSASQVVQGEVVLCLAEAIIVRGIDLKLQGSLKLAWEDDNGGGRSSRSRNTKHEATSFLKEWHFTVDTGNRQELLAAGNYEFPFSTVVSGDTLESIEGLPGGSYNSYRLKAYVQRPKYAQNVVCRRHLRMVRTLDPSSLELSHGVSVESVWPDKVEYSISSPSKAVMLAAPVPIDFRLIPLLKGLRLGRIFMSLHETHDFMILDKHQKVNREIMKHDFEPPSESEPVDETGQEGFNFSQIVTLPNNLMKCVQDVDSPNFKIRHKLKINIQLRNPDEHISELRATLPICIFLSPNMPVDDDNNIIEQNGTSAAAIQEEASHAPPIYGEHQFDQLWSDVDPAQYMTPITRSQAATPFSGSRAGSSENLQSLITVMGGVPPSELQRSLDTLPESPRGTGPRGSAGSIDPPTISSSTDVSSSPEDTMTALRDQQRSRQHSVDYSSQAMSLRDFEKLSQVPSYHTAVKTPVRTPYRSDLPDYWSSSRPHSPNRRVASGTSTPRRSQ